MRADKSVRAPADRMKRHGQLMAAIEDANTGADYLDLNFLRSTLMVYGYKDMQVEEYNHAEDWRP